MMVRWPIMFFSALLVACALPPKPNTDPFVENAIAVQWPAAPARERVKYIGEFASPSEMGYKAGFSMRFRNFLGGSSDAHLVRPYAIDENPRWLLIADPGAGSVFCFDKTDKRYSVIGASESQLFSSPVGVALGNDSFYVADSALGKVFVFDYKQRLIETLEQFDRPTSLAYDHASRRLYVADTGNHSVFVLGEQGTILRRIGSRGSGESEFNFPSHIALVADRLLVVDALNFRVQMFTLEGEYLGAFGIHGDQPGHFAQPKGIATDPDGHIYVAESVTGLIQIFAMDGTFLLAFGAMGSEPGSFLLPAGIHIEGNRIYVADSGNGRIQVFQYLGAR